MTESMKPEGAAPGKSFTPLAKAVQIMFRGVETITRLTNWVAIFVLSCMMFLTFMDVFMRYLFNMPISGGLEITQFMMAIVVAAAVGYCALKKGHIIVDIFFNKLSQKNQAIFNIFHYFIGAILLGLIAWKTGLEGAVVQGRNLTTPVLLIPVFPFYWIVAIGCAVLCLAWLYNGFESISQAITLPSRDTTSKLQEG